MSAIRSLEDLQRFREEVLAARQRRAGLGQFQVVVSLGSCGIGAGALETLRALQQQGAADHLSQVVVSQAGCAGLCRHEPVVDVVAAGGTRVTYGRVTPDVMRRILRQHVLGGKIVEEFVVET
jgi:NADP-reducing hydrogenase subunit HndB